jgi:hypothetical protein
VFCVVDEDSGKCLKAYQMSFSLLRFTSHESGIFNMRGLAIVSPGLRLMRFSLDLCNGVFIERFTFNSSNLKEFFMNGARRIIVSVLVHGKDKVIILKIIRGSFIFIQRRKLVVDVLFVTLKGIF